MTDLAAVAATTRGMLGRPASNPVHGTVAGHDARRDAGIRPEDTRLRAVAERFEAVFLAEMLRHTGFGKMPDGFNGGAGEAAFSGTLIEEYAKQIAARGGLGIGEHIYSGLLAADPG